MSQVTEYILMFFCGFVSAQLYLGLGYLKDIARAVKKPDRLPDCPD